MRFVRARVTNYKSVDDSGWVAVDGVTCLVGKNESGKTAFLQALKRVNPVAGAEADFDLKDYPRKGYVQYKRSHKEAPAVVVRAEFELSEQEVRDIEAEFGSGVLKSRTVTALRGYANVRSWEVEVDEEAMVRHWLAGAGLPAQIEEHVRNAKTRQQLVSMLEGLDFKPPSVLAFLADTSIRFKTDVGQQIIDDYLEKALPRFVYFDEYSTMRGRISIQDLRRRRDGIGQLDDADRTFLSLLSLVSCDLEDLESETGYEYMKAELESASIGISDEIFKFWNQNRELRVEFDLSSADPDDSPPLNSGTILHVRIWNNRHRVSVSFDERSRGFVWFFSFLSYFSQLEEEQDRDMILLLDEPGLNLHAMAQNDFLRFIDESLAPKHQVIYTTHSPFMINLDNLPRVRTVEDVDDKGTIITDDALGNDRETVFPLQVALGYQMAHTLFLAPHCLLVNAPSDLIYLQMLGEVAASRNGTRLDPRWVVIPVGGAENLPTFVSLLGESYVSVAVLMDVTPTNKERVEQWSRNGAPRDRNPIKWVEVTRVRDADMEDLFDPTFYLKMVNESYASELPAELTLKAISDSNPRITERIATHFRSEGIAGGVFDPYRPAAYMLQRHAALIDEIDYPTFERANSLFERINSMLPYEAAHAGRPENGAVKSPAPTA